MTIAEAKAKARNVRAISFFIAFILVVFLGILIALIMLISGEGWCDQLHSLATLAGEDGAYNITQACSDTQRLQLTGLKWIAYMVCGTNGLTVLAVTVVVWAQAKVDASISLEGGKVNVQ